MELFKYTKNKKICLVANDAGGAEILKSFAYYSNSNLKFILTGPEKKIFKKKTKINNYKKIIDKSDLVITGTSYMSDTEYKCIKYCKKKNIKVFSVLDHWVNYKIRFIRNKKYLLPDKIIVCDNEAKKIASRIFKNLLFMKNPNWKYIKEKFKNKNKNKNNYLFVSSNYNRLKKKYNDAWILNKLINHLEKKNENYNLFIRRHPTEENKKFKNFNSRSKIKIILDNNKNLISSLRNKFVICGHNSMAMVIGKICGLKTLNINIQNQKYTIPSKYIDICI